MLNNILFIIIVLMATACQEGGTSRKVTGKAGELVVVVNDDYWEAGAGKTLRQVLAQEHVALPQDEPIFDLVRIPPDGFKSIFKTTRNILQVRISSNLDSYGVNFQEDLWATPQAVVTLQASDEAHFNELFDEYSNRIISFFLKAEKGRLTSNYNRYYQKGVFNVLNDNFGLKMKVAPGFQIAKQTDDVVWLRYETPDISQGILLYTFPYVTDSAFTLDYQIKVRDSILMAHVPGPTEGSYMATEQRISQTYNVNRHNGNYATEMRGLWRLINDFMGGPYISLSLLDTENQRVVVAYGYVFAPNKDKRNLLRQVEAMIYSLSLNNQENNDKLNIQYNLDDV